MRLAFISVMLLLPACQQSQIVNANAVPVYAAAETAPVVSAADAADDPAIWINPADPGASLILGTNKQLGLAVYNLEGRQVQFVERGRLNNVDLRGGIRLGNREVTLAVATNRTYGTLDLFSISDRGRVEHVYEQALTLEAPYGVCMTVDTGGVARAFVNSTDGEYQEWWLNPGAELAPRLVGGFRVGSQPEGCAVDDVTGILYLGEENAGIWMLPAGAARAADMVMLDRTGAGHLTADVEGMDVYRNDAGQVYLIVSSQGDNSYALYDLANGNTWLGSFRIDDNEENGVDGTQETDGLAVTSRPLGGRYPAGLLVVQDGYNRRPRENQNFKLVPWQEIARAFNLNP